MQQSPLKAYCETIANSRNSSAKQTPSVMKTLAGMVSYLSCAMIFSLITWDNATKEAAHILSQHVYVRSVALPDDEKPDTVAESFLSQFT